MPNKTPQDMRITNLYQFEIEYVEVISVWEFLMNETKVLQIMSSIKEVKKNP